MNQPAKLTSKLSRKAKEVIFPFADVFMVGKTFMETEIGNRIFTVLFESPVCHRMKMATEKPTKTEQRDKGFCCEDNLF